MGTELRKLGETHAHGTVIDVAYFDVFVQAIITVLRQELMAEFSARINFAWIRLLGYVAYQVKEGYRGRKVAVSAWTSRMILLRYTVILSSLTRIFFTILLADLVL